MYSDENRSSSLAKLLNGFDQVILDTSSLMVDGFPNWMDVLANAKEYVKEELKIIVFYECLEELKKHSKDKKNPNNGHVRFIIDEERSLRAWMTENLIFHYLPNDEPKQLESILIRRFNPPLNLSENENPVNREFRSHLTFLRGQRPWIG